MTLHLNIIINVEPRHGVAQDTSDMEMPLSDREVPSPETLILF
jgi:hypothetical protein